MTNLSEEFGCSPGLVSANGIQRRFSVCAHGDIFWNLIESERDRFVFTIFGLVWNQTNIHLVPDQSRKGECNLVSIWFGRISAVVG